MIGVRTRTDKYVLERAMEVVMDGGADGHARCLVNTSDKHAAALVAIESLGQRTSFLERALDTGQSLEDAQGLTTGRSARTINHRATGRGRGTVVFPRGMHG